MKIKNISKWFFVAAMCITVTACSEEDTPDTNTTVITVDKGNENAFDKYLNKIFVEPYNISVKYKMEDIETDMNYQLVPAQYENSVKMANLVKYLCLDSYDEVAPDGFLKAYFPKMIMMVGSPAYRNNGTMLLGTAEGGLKITLYNINNLDISNINILYAYYFRTIFHEFSHILHQTIDYTTDFDKISATDYVGGSWNDAWGSGESLKAGFISDYSSKEADEDFVELIAHYITNTEDSWNNILELAGESGKETIQQKMSIISYYLLEDWDIDIDKLREAIQTRAAVLYEQDFDNITIE